MNKHGIEWISSVDDNNQIEEPVTARIREALKRTVLDVGCAYVFIWAAVLIIVDVYGVEMPMALWFILLTLCLFFISASSELFTTVFPFGKKWVPVGVLAIGITAFGGYLLGDERADNVMNGLFAFSRLYIRDWSSLYDLGLSWYVGNKDYMEMGVWFFLLALTFFVFWISKIGKKRWLVGVIPFAEFIAVLLVGKVPGKLALFLLMAGILLLTGMSWEKADLQFVPWKQKETDTKSNPLRGIVTGAIMAIVGGVVLLGGGGVANRLIEKHSDDTMVHFAQTADAISDWALWSRLVVSEEFADMLEKLLRDVDSNYEEISNDSPMYEHIPVLEVVVSQAVTENLYLKGYYGDIYEDGFWKRDLKNLEWACHKADIDYEEIEGQIAILPVEKLAHRYQIESLSRIGLSRDVTVNYIDMTTSKVYMPYFSEIASQNLVADGDSYYTKPMSENMLLFLQWNQKERDFVRQNKEKEDWELWYEEYVKTAYLEVPDTLKAVRIIAEEIATCIDRDIRVGVSDEYEEEMTENDLRMLKAEYVADWMTNNTTYSLELEELPEGEDPIEYFLSTSKTGYCMHYASASVMILRELGVPARYASGYIATTETFKKTTEGIKATILDDQAHSWVEVYLDGMGWMPVEVTKTYPATDTAMALMEDLDSTEVIRETDKKEAEQNSGIQGETGTGSFGVVIEEIENPDEEDGTISSDIEKTDEIATEGENGTGETETNTEKDKTPPTVTVVKPHIIPAEEEEEEGGLEKRSKFIFGWDTVVWILGIVAAVAAVVSFVTNTHRFFRTESGHYKQIRKEIRRGNYRDVIIMINNAIYRKLCFNKLLVPGHGDCDYEIALKASYPELCHGEWDRYMELVKAATFSEREFTKSEIKFCYEIYRDVVYKNEIGR